MYLKKHQRVTEGYKKMILSFVIITVILVVVILYFSAGRAIIEVSPVASPVETSFVIDVAADGGGGLTAINGILFESEVSGEFSEEATGSQALEGDSVGSVTLINERNESQTLVKTTRLLSTNNVLLRLSDRVIVPAGGEIEAKVYADDPSAFEQLEPTSFIIPGLWEGLQDEIYAESKGVLKNTGDSVKVVKAADIARAKDKVTEELYAEAIVEFNAQLPNANYASLVVSKTVVEEEISAEVDEQADQVTAKMKIKVVLIGLPQEEVIELAGSRLQSVVPDGMDLQNVNTNNFDYTVQNFDEEEKTANVKVHVDGQAVIKANNAIFQKDKIVGLSPKGVELYLANFEQVDDVTVELSPFWVKKVPKLKDHVDIIIVNPNK